MAVLKRAAPETSMRLLDLALFQPNQRKDILSKTLREHQPDIIAFSWRDIQIFSPQEMDQAMRDAFTFFYDPSPIRKALTAFRGLGHIFTFHSQISENLSLIRVAVKAFPNSIIALGGPAVKIFGEHLRSKLPPSIHVFQEISSHAPFFHLLGLNLPENPQEPELNLEALEAAFPEWKAYCGETIGIQSKKGCPLHCLFCLYGFLEGKEIRRRDPNLVVREMETYYKRWGSRQFWFVDAQLLSGPGDYAHLVSILEGTLNAGLNLHWSGYLRIHKLDHVLADLMVRSGLCDLEISINSGAQPVLDQLQMGFSVDEVLDGCVRLKAAGYSGRVLLNLSLNAPGETRETLAQTIKVVKEIRHIFRRDCVVPVIFFLAIQPYTQLEKRALEEGQIEEGYNPLSTLPWKLHRLIYNPPPLGKLIGQSCAQVFRNWNDKAGERILADLEGKLNTERC